jgi:rod shape determining protein RodA
MATMSMPKGPAANFNRNPASPWRHLDLLLLGATGAVAALGVVMVYSATKSTEGTGYLARQGVFVLIGVAVLGVVTLVDYRRIRDLAPLLYGGGMLLLLAVLSPAGTTVNGAKSWFALGSFQLQPAEFMKLATIVLIAAVASAATSHPLPGRTTAACLLLAALPIGLILLQPDLGSALVFVTAAAAVVFVGGIHSRQLAVLALLAALGAVYLFGYSSVLDDYQRDRLTTFVSADAQNTASFQVRQAETAIGAGGVTGAGLFQGTQTKLSYVPYQESDFIVTVVGEELGFAGSATLLLLYGVIAWRIWRAAAVSRDLFGTLVCVGVLAIFLFQVFENMGMAMGIMPVTGIPLPFLSYGGSSTITMFAAIGLVLNVHTRRFS